MDTIKLEDDCGHDLTLTDANEVAILNLDGESVFYLNKENAEKLVDKLLSTFNMINFDDLPAHLREQSV